VLAEAVEGLFVEAAVVREPGAGFGDGLSTQMGWALPGVAAARHQPGPFQDVEVLAHRLQRDGGEQRREVVNGRVALGQPGENGPAGRIGERTERDAESVSGGGGGHYAAISLSRIIPDGAVVLLVTANVLGAGPVNSLRPSPLTIGPIRSRYSSTRPAARRVSVSCPLP